MSRPRPPTAPSSPNGQPSGALTPALAHTAPQAPTAPLRHRSSTDVQVQLVRLADLFAEVSSIYRDLSQIALDVVPARPLMKSVEPVRFLTAKDIADQLRVDAKTIRRWHQSGQIPKGITIGGVVRWPAPTIDSWIQEKVR